MVRSARSGHELHRRAPVPGARTWMVLGGMGRTATALGWLVLAALTGIAYIGAATSSRGSTAVLIFIAPFAYGTIANVIIFAVDASCGRGSCAGLKLELHSAAFALACRRAGLFNAAYEGLPRPVPPRRAAARVHGRRVRPRISTRRESPSATGSRSVSGTSACAARTRGSAASASWRAHAARASARRSCAPCTSRREHGVRRVWLEVVIENTGALALYEKLGYEHVQDVEVSDAPRCGGRPHGPRGRCRRG